MNVKARITKKQVNVENKAIKLARKMNLVRSTVHEHRTRSLELLKQIMEENKSECEK